MRQGGATVFGPIVVSVAFSLLSMPASILGNEAALRFGRHRALTVLMIASGVVAVAVGLSVQASPVLLLVLLFLYALTVPSDSGALTSGMVMSATPALKGTTMAMHTTFGFGLAALGSWVAGIVLDSAGGPNTGSGWLAVFCLLAGSILLGPVALWWSRRADHAD
jgi:hypothetical protein